LHKLMEKSNSHKLKSAIFYCNNFLTRVKEEL